MGTITTTLVFDDGVHFGTREKLLNLAALVATVVAFYVLWHRGRRLVLPITCVLAVSLAALSALNVHTIASTVAEERAALAEATDSLVLPDGTPRQILHLSKTRRNVVVVFLDRAISAYLPYIMAERPDVAEQLDGFTFYPNTVSHGWFTNFGSPGLYGGYEYTPAAMNARPDENLADKHNEAMLLMPTLMSGAGLRTTVVDPPYAGSYTWNNDLSLYDGLDNVEAFNVGGTYGQLVRERLGIGQTSNMRRRFVYYAALKVAPELLQRKIYDEGRYLSVAEDSFPKAGLMNQLAALEVLPEITDASGGAGGFVLLGNTTTHEEDYLQLPDYDIASNVSNEGLEDFSRFELDGQDVRMDSDLQLTHYHVNAAALIRLGRWFAWMREQGVWDNTRVIVVADHGRNLASVDDWIFDDYLDLMKVNPLLMVKDFDATGFTVSDEFMTNADVPTIAMDGVVAYPVNPFTGNLIDEHEKYEHDQLVTLSHNYNVEEFHDTTFDTSDAPWYSVHDNIFDSSNWTRYETYEQATEAVPQ